MSIADDYFTADELASELGIRRVAVYYMAAKGIGPPRTAIGKRVLYRRAAVMDWLITREVAQVPKYESRRFGICKAQQDAA